MISTIPRWIAYHFGLILSFYNVCCIEGASLHLFFVGDINPRDSEILHIATKRDVAAVRSEVKKIARNIDLELSETCLFGSSVCASEIISKCKKLSVSSEDIVFFYFSGHGYTTPSQAGDPWPNLSCSGDGCGVPLSRIARIIRKLNPRLALMLADCCNTLIAEEDSPLVLKATKGTSRRLERNYKKLFLETKGTIIIAGSKKKQPSLATGSGSFCTNSFLKSIQEKVCDSTDAINWASVLDLTSHYLLLTAREYGREQNLIFSIE